MVIENFTALVASLTKIDANCYVEEVSEQSAGTSK